MHEAVKQMLEPYNCRTQDEYKNALKEIIQQIALLGLSRQGFFDSASIYGGSALRIAHGLDRFSEDLDFTLTAADPGFVIDRYLKGIEQELFSYDLVLSAVKIEKTQSTPIESAFIKGNALSILLSIDDLKNPASGTHKNELLKIKLEVDTDPPMPSGNTEVLFQTRPIPFSFSILTLNSLFSGKLHAILCRDYPSGRVKGRDFYDFIWYVSSQISPDLPYLEAKLKQSGKIGRQDKLDIGSLRKMLREKFSTIDFNSARKDVVPFIKDEFALKVWSIEFFMQLLERL